MLGRTKIRFIDPPVPERDGWGNSVPRRREGGIVGRWLREALDNVLPPLPTAQWDYLKAVGLGEERCGPLPVRRTKVGTWGSAESLLSVENLKVSIRTSQADVLRDRVNQRNRHDITPKFLQRLHASIWHLSPKMTWDEESKNWRYGWGKPKGSVLQGKRTAVSPRDLQLFEGLENMEGVVDVVGGGFKGKKARKKARAQALKQLEAARMEKEKTVGEASETASF